MLYRDLTQNEKVALWFKLIQHSMLIIAFIKEEKEAVKPLT